MGNILGLDLIRIPYYDYDNITKILKDRLLMESRMR